MNTMLLAEGVKLQPMPADDAEHVLVAVIALALAAGLAALAFWLASHVTGRTTTAHDAAGISHSHSGAGDDPLPFFLAFGTFCLALFVGGVSLTVLVCDTPVTPGERQAVETNVRTVQNHYGIHGLSGWDGRPDDGVHDVSYLPKETAAMPAPDGYLLKRTKDGSRLVKEKPRKARLLVHDGTAALYDRESGKELQ